MSITVIGAPILRAKAKRVGTFRDPWVAAFLDRMTRELVAADAAGIAAPQLAVSRRMAVVRLSGAEHPEILELVNPEVVRSSGEATGLEGCLSIPGEAFRVTRPTTLEVRYQDRGGRWRLRIFGGFDARLVRHELDHLEGRLVLDVGEHLGSAVQA